jgi:hypothetical protein
MRERMDRDLVERRDDGFYLVGSRVPLDCVVREFGEGQSPETICSDFSTLSLEQVYGAITFYLGHKDQVDNDMEVREGVEDSISEEHPAPSRSEREAGAHAWSIADAATHRRILRTNWRPPRFVIDGFERCRSEGEHRG